jgi:Fe-S-cluster containining protein
MKKKKNETSKIKRRSFPEEKESPWLSMLLDAYHIINKGIAKAIEAEGKRGRKLACEEGCSNCCSTHRDIPIYPLELMGISWYVAEKLTGDVRDILKQQLADYKWADHCPFLIEGSCSIHSMRPMACRQFNVFTKQCEEGEDPYYTRNDDVLPPVKKYVDQAFFIMLPFHGVEKESEKIKAVESGALNKTVKVLQECNWRLLAERMEKTEKHED